MSKYIDADALKNQRPENLNNRCENYDKAVYASGWNDCNECWCDLVDEMPTADVEPVPRWISVDERLPEYDETQGANAYWVAGKRRNGEEFGMRIALYCDYGYAMGIEGIPTKVTWRDENFRVIENVTHWMNLSEPPKMDGGSE